MNLVVSKSFTDIWGNSTSFYRSNAGDKITATFVLNNIIEFRSSNENQITTSLTPNKVTRSNGSWEDDGWRVGDSYIIVRYQSNGNVGFGFPVSGTVTFINGNEMGVTDLHPTMTNGATYGTSQPFVITCLRYHDALTLYPNHVLNAGGGSSQSLIDGEETKIRFEGLNALAVSGSISGTVVGNKSGGFNCSATLTRINNPGSLTRRYDVVLTIINPGLIDDEWFLGASCLKLYTKFAFESVIGEPFGTLDLIDQDTADTGYLDEGFNSQNPNATLIQGIQAIDWANATTVSITVDTAATNFYIGGMYLPLDETYYKNKPQSQSELCMQLNSHVPISGTTYGSFSNPSGASWNLVVSPATVVGTQRTYTLVFVPNSNFQTFMDGREEGDRRFILYFRAGNTNLTLFDGQLTKEMPPAGPLPNIDTFTMVKHNQNVQDGTGIDNLVSSNRINYTEDDSALICKMLWEKGRVYTALRVKVIAKGGGNEFVLQQTSFDLTNAQISSDGRQLLNLTSAQQNNLPSTSAKKEAKLELYPTLDTVTEYGIKVYYPFLFDWRYWEPLAGVNSAFYPDQNKNWEPYSAAVSWNVYVQVEIDDDQGEYLDDYVVFIRDYDSGNTTASIEYFRPDATPVLALVDGEIMTIRIKHITATALNPSSIWAIASVETFEGNSIWYTSTVISSDGNILNPLGPISVTVTGNDTYLEFTLDTNKIDGTNGLSISSRIFGNDVFTDKWITTTGDKFEQTQGGNWEIQ